MASKLYVPIIEFIGKRKTTRSKTLSDSNVDLAFARLEKFSILVSDERKVPPCVSGGRRR